MYGVACDLILGSNFGRVSWWWDGYGELEYQTSSDIIVAAVDFYHVHLNVK